MNQLTCFNQEFQGLLHSKNPEAYSMMVFIRARLKQFELLHVYSEAEILSEAYARGLKFILSGGSIDSPQAWIRATSFNIIRELSRGSVRDRKRLSSLETLSERDLPYEPPDHNLVDPEELNENLRKIMQAFCQLDPRAQEILKQRIIQKRSWQEIAQDPALQGNSPCSIATLRQQGHRALLKLRRLFHQL